VCGKNTLLYEETAKQTVRSWIQIHAYRNTFRSEHSALDRSVILTDVGTRDTAHTFFFFFKKNNVFGPSWLMDTCHVITF